MSDLRHLLERLRLGARPPLSVDEVELLLGWLTGSAAREEADVIELPRPGHDPVLLQMVLHHLDDALFYHGELRPAAAGLDASDSAAHKRIRFRRLASAFHPDRFPELADWLTQRSQSVHRAYARFKQDLDASVDARGPSRPQPPPHDRGPLRRNMRRAAPRVRKQRARALANRLRARFGNDRYLAHKLIGGLALLAMLPILNMALVPTPGSGEGANSAMYSKDRIEGLRLTEQPQEPAPDFDQSQDSPAAATGARLDGASSSGDGSARHGRPAMNQAVGTDEGQILVGEGSIRGEGDAASRIAAAAGAAAETHRVNSQPGTESQKPLSSAADPGISRLLAAARRAMRPNDDAQSGASLQSVDEQLTAMGLKNDTERLYRRIGTGTSVSRVPGSGETQIGATAAEPEPALAKADVGGDGPAPAPAPSGNRAADNQSTGPGVEPAGDDSGPESGIADQSADAAKSSQSGREHQKPKPTPEERSESLLALGPLATHPAGEVLKKLHAGLTAGDVAGVVASFTPDARLGALRGRDQIADYFRSALHPVAARIVHLKVLRLSREDGGWLVEADFDIRADQSELTEHLTQGRNNLWLAKRGDQLLIARMESE